MRKFSLLISLLFVSVMGWAGTFCNTLLTSENSASPAGDCYTDNVYFTASKTGPLETTFSITSTTRTLTGSIFNGQALMQNPGGGTLDGDFATGWTLTGNTLTKVATWTTYPTGNIQVYIVVNIDGAPPITGAQIPNLDVSAACSSKPSPELSLNATSKTLEIDATAETFQIVPTKEAGSGAVSYESSDDAIATVSNTGLVTAVGNGTATITVSVEENGDFAADSKTLTVEVIDWPNIGWLQNGENAYKLHISPAIGGTQRIEGSNLYVQFPDAVIGDMSITPSGGDGAWRTFSLTNFMSYKSQFTAVWRGNTYTFTVYRNFDGVNLAKGMPSYAGATALPKAWANDGDKGSRWASGGGANHYAAVGDMAQDWWYVDLGAMYEISSIKTLYEGAAPKNYDFLTSPNGDSWVVIDSYNATPNIGNGDENYNEYSYSPGKVGRYVKIFAREAVQGDFAYGISMWEFEVYGQPAESYDTNDPVLSSAALSGDPTSSQVQIAVSATDAEGAVTTYRVKDTSHGIDRNCAVAAGVITISGLAEGTNYSFTITALDAIGNQSNAIVVAASTSADLTIPQVAAPTPDGTGKDVLAIYSDAFPNILAHSFDKDGFAGMTVYAEKNIDGNSCLIYDRSGSAPTYTTWGMHDDGANAIIAATGYSDPDNAAHKGVYAAGMDNLHIDIWSLQACATILIRINDGGRAGDLRLSHNGSGWQSYDIPLSEFEAGANIDNVRWFKFEAFDAVTGKIAIDNVYFWEPESGSKTVSVSVNNGSMGSATAKVGDDEVTLVTDGTEVTFTATPNSGYDFINWTQGGVEVSTSATYVTTITANTALVANFEVARTAYCAVPVTDNAGGTLYLTISNPSANTYKILFEGSENNKINGSNVYLDTQLRLRNVNNVAEYHFSNGDGIWTVSTEGFGSAYITFTATNYRDISFSNKHICLFRNNANGGSDLSIYDNIPDANLIKWDASCIDDEAPVLSTPTATPLSGTSVRLALSATDNMSALLTYHINYKPTGDAGAGTNVDVPGTAGATTYHNIKGLSAGTNYTFSVTVSDAVPNTSAAQVCNATPSMPKAPVPTHEAAAVRSIYSDKYESALEHDFQKDSWHGYDLTYVEVNMGGDHALVYDLVPYNQDAWFSWGAVDGANAIIAKDGYNDGVNDGLDASGMDYLHIDIMAANAAPYAEIQIMDVKLGDIPLTGSGWQSFDLPLAAFKAAQAEKIADINHIKFIGFRGPNNPEEIAIDNVYFWQEPKYTRNDSWMAPGELGTVCYPEGLRVAGATMYQMAGTDANGKFVFDEVEVLAPGVPYLFEAQSNELRFYATAATPAAEAGTSNGMVGTFTEITIPQASPNIYYFSGRKFYAVTARSTDLTVPANRAYVDLTEPHPAMAPKPGIRRITFDVEGTSTITGCEQIDATDAPAKILIDGQMYILRGEKLYDATGRLVK